jgi:outer membrane receptor protein involved in Fe transport
MKLLWTTAGLQMLLTTAALAQQGDPAAPISLEEVTVTATRVQRTDFTAPTPTTILSARDLAATGATNIGDMTSLVPAFQATGTPTSSVLASDQGRGHFLDLRGLGPSRTLVLVDGQRFVPTTANGLLDADVIPAALVERLEVVTGGASASWGSDAVSGVVNIILKKDVDGLEGSVQGGLSQHGDNQEAKVDLAYGLPFAAGRGHFELAGEFSDNHGILHQSDRGWSRQEWGYVQTDQYRNVPVTNARLSIASYGGLILTGPLAGMQFGPGSVLQPFQYGKNVGSTYMQGGDGAVFSSFSALEVPLKRASVFARTSFDLTDDVSAFLDASFAQAITNNPNLVQNFDLVDSLSTDNAFLPASARNAMLAAGETSFLLGRLDNDFGFIRSKDDNRVARAVSGLKGKFAGNWTWNAYVEYGRVVHYNTLDNVVQTLNYGQALDSVVDPTTGQASCRSTLSRPGDGCVPINIFGVGSPSPAALKYVTGTESTVLHYTQQVAAASIQGEPFSTWAGPASIATGFEYRRESADNAVDANQEAGNFLIGNGQSFEGHFNVKEGFVETVLPVVAGPAPFKAIDLDLGARLTDYSSSGRVTTWKVGISYTLFDELRFRATRSRDIRAPNLSELYQTASLNFTNVSDPAAGGASTFIRNPAPPNPNLAPEKADTTTIGLIYQPKWATGLHTSVDAYDIEVASVISQLAPQDVLNRCTAGDQALCSLVKRDNTGALTEIDTPFINLAQFHTRGLDLEARYETPLSWGEHLHGNLTLRALANYVDLFATSDGVTTVNEAGAVGAVNLPSNIGATGGVPHWRANLSANYGQGPWAFYVEGRFVGQGKVDNLYGPADIPNNRVASRFYVNTSVNYTLYQSKRRELQLYAVINNLFDRDPPIVVSTFISPLATNPALYDVIGRTFAVGIRFRD